MCLAWGSSVDHQNDDAVQGEEGVEGHEEGEELQEDPAGRLAKDFDSDKAADEKEADGDDVRESRGAVVGEDEIDGPSRGDDGEDPGVADLPGTVEEMKDSSVEEDECGQQEAMRDDDGDEGGDGLRDEQKKDVADGCCEERNGHGACATQVGVDALHAAKDDGKDQRQCDLAAEKGGDIDGRNGRHEAV